MVWMSLICIIDIVRCYAIRQQTVELACTKERRVQCAWFEWWFGWLGAAVESKNQIFEGKRDIFTGVNGTLRRMTGLSLKGGAMYGTPLCGMAGLNLRGGAVYPVFWSHRSKVSYPLSIHDLNSCKNISAWFLLRKMHAISLLSSLTFSRRWYIFRMSTI